MEPCTLHCPSPDHSLLYSVDQSLCVSYPGFLADWKPVSCYGHNISISLRKEEIHTLKNLTLSFYFKCFFCRLSQNGSLDIGFKSTDNEKTKSCGGDITSCDPIPIGPYKLYWIMTLLYIPLCRHEVSLAFHTPLVSQSW